MSTYREHDRTPRAEMSGTAVRDLAHALLNGAPRQVEYADLAQLARDAGRHNIDPRAVAIARERLTAAVERGSAAAAEHLARLAEVTR